MKNLNIRVPLFPLPVFLLPGGISRLRIFEPRYLKMVTIASKAHGFVISGSGQANTETKIDWGSWVDIVNFDQGSDGVLEIDVQCKSLVELGEINQNADKLTFATVSEVPHWSAEEGHAKATKLAQSLADLFTNDSRLNAMYLNKSLDNMHWVVARWLELLPVNMSVKERFVNQHNYHAAKHFVQAILFQDE